MVMRKKIVRTVQVNVGNAKIWVMTDVNVQLSPPLCHSVATCSDIIPPIEAC